MTPDSGSPADNKAQRWMEQRERVITYGDGVGCDLHTGAEPGREREREKERERETEREEDSDSDRERQRESEREKVRKEDRMGESGRERQIETERGGGENTRLPCIWWNPPRHLKPVIYIYYIYIYICICPMAPPVQHPRCPDRHAVWMPENPE